MYDIERRHTRGNQNIRDVCAENYAYDTDNSVESFLERHVEAPAASAIEKLLADPCQASAPPSDALLRFLIVQIARTRQAYEGQMQFIDKFMRTVFETFATLSDRDPEEVRDLRIRPSEPRQALSHMALRAAENFRLLSDLRVAIVVNETPQEFLLADHPVFQHNWYLRDCVDSFSASLCVRGLQIFVPLSPQVTYCLYDSAVYAYHEDRKSSIVQANLSDVRVLNTFQAINAKNLLVGKSMHMTLEMQSLGEKFANTPAFTSHAQATAPKEDADGNLRTLHRTWRKQIRLDSLPSFIKVKNKVRRRPTVCEYRSPDIVAAYELANAQLRAKAP